MPPDENRPVIPDVRTRAGSYLPSKGAFTSRKGLVDLGRGLIRLQMHRYGMLRILVFQIDDVVPDSSNDASSLDLASKLLVGCDVNVIPYLE